MQITDLLNQNCLEACDNKVPRFQSSTRIRDVITRVLREEYNEFLVVDDKGHYIGVTRQRDVLNPPRIKVILVDHNEPGQALGALEEAELVEILDHHRLGKPFDPYTDPVYSGHRWKYEHSDFRADRGCGIECTPRTRRDVIGRTTFGYFSAHISNNDIERSIGS